jgi:hypothetical protein
MPLPELSWRAFTGPCTTKLPTQSIGEGRLVALPDERPKQFAVLMPLTSSCHQGCRQSPGPERLFDVGASGKESQDRKIEDRKMGFRFIFLSLFCTRKDCAD